MNHEWREYPVRWLTCDVLIIGAGLAGLTAAWAAAQTGARVWIACKGFAGADGVSTFAGGVVLYLLPDDDWETFLAEHHTWSEGLFHPEALRHVTRASAALWTTWARNGAPLEQEPDGRLQRRWLRVGGRMHVPRLALDSVAFMRFLRRQARRFGVRFLEQTCITGLIRKPDGTVTGAVGFQRQEGELVAVISSTVVLAAGGCSWRGAHMGQHNVMGDACRLAVRAGAELGSMEFCASYIPTCSLFDSHGQCVLAALGGRFRNRHGEDILERWGEEGPVPVHRLALAMVHEYLSGRGPVVYDLTGIPAALRADWEAHFPLVARGFERSDVDVFRQPVPWFPGFTGSIGGNGGVRQWSLSGETGVPGLWVAGDAAMRTPVVGAASGITFLNLAWAAASGYWAGLSAGYQARDREPDGSAPEIIETVEAEWRHTIRPLERRNGIAAPELLQRLQRIIVDPMSNFLRTDEHLRTSLREVAAIRHRAEELSARGWHDLARCHEVASAALTAEAVLTSALARQETRGWHRRLDFADRDDLRWSRWTIARFLPDSDGDCFTVYSLDPLDPASFRAEPPLSIKGAIDL